MKKHVWIILSLLVGASGPLAAEPNEPNGWLWSIWPTAGQDVVELRAGVRHGILEIYGAARRDMVFEDDTPEITGARLYLICNAIDANMVSQLRPDWRLPAGRLYAGIFPGWRITSNDSEFGFILGGRIQIAEDANFLVEFSTEYEHLWHRQDGQTDGDAVTFGVPITFK